jgi:transcription initiation factor TFIID TATA-box-binding protein
VITTANLKQKIDAPRFVNYSWGMYDSECYGGLCGYIKDEKIDGRVIVFLSGKMISTGAKSIQKSILQLRRAMDLMILNNFIKKVSLSPRVRNIVSTANLQRHIDLKAVATQIPHITYEHERFPGAIFRTNSGPVCLLFESGKIVITGSTSEEQLLLTFSKLQKILKNFLYRV